MEKDEETSMKIIVACVLAMFILMAIVIIFYPN
jgi:hypothetical protein